MSNTAILLKQTLKLWKAFFIEFPGFGMSYDDSKEIFREA